MILSTDSFAYQFISEFNSKYYYVTKHDVEQLLSIAVLGSFYL